MNSLPVICCNCGEHKPGSPAITPSGEYSSGICPACFLELYRDDFDPFDLECMHREITVAWNAGRPS